RTATIAFTLKDIPSADVAAQLVDDACFVSNGDFYATTVARRLRLEAAGLVRIGAACYTTADEIDRVVSGIARIGAHH
ncbi:MAG: aminotransferase class V-fold PLP-dependent enzyme, partial [Gemmatimonadales bacterium]